MSDEVNKGHNQTDLLAETRHHAGDRSVHAPTSLFKRLTGALIPLYDGPPSWLWYSGLARIVMLTVVAAGVQQMVGHLLTVLVLTAIYLAAAACCLWYLFTLRKSSVITPALTWTQMLVDFSVVAVTISFTGGASSFFTFLFVIVILEAGALMGLVQGFVFAVLSALFLLFLNLPEPSFSMDFLPYGYNLLIQGLALFSTAVISGYWNQRVSRLKQFQREILDNMSSGFLICDARGRVVSANKAACALLGHGEEQIAGQDVSRILICETGAECPVITALRNARDYISYEFQARVSGDHVKLLGLTTNRLYDSRNRIIAIIATFTDLTEMAQMRQALQRQDRLAAIGESAAELAHEVRNPLASLRSAIDELRKHIGDSDMGQRLCAIALRESEHLNRIVTGFLEFARNPEFNREPVDIAALIKDAKNAAEKTVEGITITVIYHDSLYLVLGDATQLRQLVDNIVRNSIEAMNECGALTITLRSAGNYVEIRFDDTGPGIAPDKVARIFEPFYTEKEQGIGMGLAVCQRIVLAHDGDIQAATRPGGGASMIVRLPAVKQKALDRKLAL